MFKFTIRELLLLTLAVGIGLGWLVSEWRWRSYANWLYHQDELGHVVMWQMEAALMRDGHKVTWHGEEGIGVDGIPPQRPGWRQVRP